MSYNASYTAYLASVEARKAILSATLAEVLRTDCMFKTLEIGSGHGDFLVSYAQRYPERFCFGIDLITQRVGKSNRKAQRLALANCQFLKARAEELLDCLPDQWLWNEVLIFYPDPWPKKRHHKHRLLQAPFLSQLARTVTPGACIHFETDDVDYFEAVCQTVTDHSDWQPVEVEPYIVDTFFARVTGKQGHYAVFKQLAKGL